MSAAPRSLRGRLTLLSVTLTIVAMTCLGCFSYWYIGRALSSSRQETMHRREQRILQYINTWPAHDRSLSLNEKLQQLSKAIAQTDTIQVFDMQGTVLYSSDASDEYKAPWPASRECVQPCYALLRKGGHTLRTFSHVVQMDGRPVRLAIAGLTDEHHDILSVVRDSYLTSCPLLLILSLAGALILSHRALAPIRSMAGRASTIGLRDLHQRLPVPASGDELQLLAETLNDLLKRLDTAVTQLTQLTSDVSHDLRTALTVMLSTVELALRRSRSVEEYRAALVMLLGECRSMTRMLDDLVTASETGTVQEEMRRYPLNLSEVVSEVSEALQSRAEMKGHCLRLELDGELWIVGDLLMLRRLLTTLIDNAIKYTPDGGVIRVDAKQAGSTVELMISDTGIGIPAHALPRIFDRLYRVDGSRNLDDGSSGLGLAIAKRIVEAHGATIRVESVEQRGSKFTVCIPGYTHARSFPLDGL